MKWATLAATCRATVDEIVRLREALHTRFPSDPHGAQEALEKLRLRAIALLGRADTRTREAVELELYTLVESAARDSSSVPLATRRGDGASLIGRHSGFGASKTRETTHPGRVGNASQGAIVLRRRKPRGKWGAAVITAAPTGGGSRAAAVVTARLDDDAVVAASVGTSQARIAASVLHEPTGAVKILPAWLSELRGVGNDPQGRRNLVMAGPGRVGLDRARAGRRQTIVVGRDEAPDDGLGHSAGYVVAVERLGQGTGPGPVPPAARPILTCPERTAAMLGGGCALTKCLVICRDRYKKNFRESQFVETERGRALAAWEAFFQRLQLVGRHKLVPLQQRSNFPGPIGRWLAAG